jgi:hypothetical protein
MEVTTAEGQRDCCCQIHLLAQLVLSAFMAHLALSAHCVSVISRSIITILLYREILQYFEALLRLPFDFHERLQELPTLKKVKLSLCLIS